MAWANLRLVQDSGEVGPQWLEALPVSALRAIIQWRSIEQLGWIDPKVAWVTKQQLDGLRYWAPADLSALPTDLLKQRIKSTTH